MKVENITTEKSNKKKTDAKESKRQAQVLAMERDLKAFDSRIEEVVAERDEKLREVETEQRKAAGEATREITDEVAPLEKARKDDIKAARQRRDDRVASAKKDFIKEESEIERKARKARGAFEKKIVDKTASLQAIADGKAKKVTAEYDMTLDSIVEARTELVDKLQALRRGKPLGRTIEKVTEQKAEDNSGSDTPPVEAAGSPPPAG